MRCAALKLCLSLLVVMGSSFFYAQEGEAIEHETEDHEDVATGDASKAAVPTQNNVQQQQASSASDEQQEAEETAHPAQKEAEEPTTPATSNDQPVVSKPSQEAKTDASPAELEKQHTHAEKTKQVLPPVAQVAEKPSGPVASDTTPENGQPQSEVNVGLDTLNVNHDTKGNWLYKRFWWERARKLYEDIARRSTILLDSKKPFFDKRTALDRDVFDQFYTKNGFEKGELTATLTRLINDLEQERTQKGVLSEPERDVLSKLAQEKETLEKLRQDTEIINKLDNSIDDALAVLNGQVTQCRAYEEQALQKLNEITRELSDKRAKELYHEMRILFDNINNIESYLKGPFTAYFEGLGSKAQELIDQANTALARLKEQGIDLGKQVEQVHADEKKAVDSQQKCPTAPEGFSITGWLSTVWNTVTGLFQQGYAWVSSFWVSPEKPAEAQVANVVPQNATQTTKEQE